MMKTCIKRNNLANIVVPAFTAFVATIVLLALLRPWFVTTAELVSADQHTNQHNQHNQPNVLRRFSWSLVLIWAACVAAAVGLTTFLTMLAAQKQKTSK